MTVAAAAAGANTHAGGPGVDQRADKGAWVSIWVDDIDAVCEQCMAEQLEVTDPPTDEPWGAREMHVRHPDGTSSVSAERSARPG